MKLKYLLRGLGIGLLFTALLFVLWKPKNAASAPTEEEIMERARALGMYTEEEYRDLKLQESLDRLTENKGSAEPEKTAVPAPSKEPSPSPAAAPTATPSAPLVPSKEPAVPASPEPSGTPPAKTPEPTPEPTVKPEPQYVAVTIKPGMFSEKVAQLLREAGAIDSASDFNRYLTENGYASKLRVGTYQIPVNASYQEIARIIT